ncbi:chemotaxis protein CheA [Candidatus Methylospira mobilis]|uniref:Chemotaxis protein CheA n=1 Tax=Candidatus Methylospira mobilis TaxID=1808979 RepID=A0A5Q0BKD0_9GAMM|nr:chemotaxis protein CheA [Candidatus Methylospira mobilis]QFY44375.1 chemotaxis protein CheA [Candidatus Methylospira mobilis]
MTPLLEQFISEARDLLQGIGEKLLQLETSPGSPELMKELFRLVHTLKGGSGLFEFPEMTRVLHAGEDLLDTVRDGRVAYSESLADRLLETMDFVGLLMDEIEATGSSSAAHADYSAHLAKSLQQLMGDSGEVKSVESVPGPAKTAAISASLSLALSELPAALRMRLYRDVMAGSPLSWLEYTPEADCFFKGEDPLFLMLQIPETVWGGIASAQAMPPLAELDAYRCQLVFRALTAAEPAILHELFRYIPEQVGITAIPALVLAAPHDDNNGVPGSESDVDGFRAIVQSQREILSLPDNDAWLPGRLQSVAATLAACLRATGRKELLASLEKSLALALTEVKALPLQTWLDEFLPELPEKEKNSQTCREVPPLPRASGLRAALRTSECSSAGFTGQPLPETPDNTAPAYEEPSVSTASHPDVEIKFGRRAEDSYAVARTLKVDQGKIDRLMSLIGEMVVAKNSLPYLANRAEAQYGASELAREIKAQYAVVNRIAEEMQDAIMQIRMMPVSFIFQRFPRLVRDTSRKLGKEVNLVLAGEDTEADKNIIEALADPLIHIVRNSLDHGLEPPGQRRAAGKPAAGRLSICASQESDRVLIDIADDGKGIDPDIIKRKAYENGLIDEAMLERITDREAVNLVFAAGFSTAAVVSDLSGRGVGMDVVRSTVEKIGGIVTLDSEKGRGTRIRLSLPLSMAVSNVMIIVTNDKVFGVPMESVVETVRVSRSAIRSIQRRLTAVLRERIIPLLSLNDLLALNVPQRANEDGELAVMVVRVHDDLIGVIVDDFRETVDIILKPLTGILGGLPGYAGSALLGDGSVLMVLNFRELI